jgi:glycosyltransferase involved in cell wall biosynthesis
LLLDAWRKLRVADGAELVLAGGWALPERLRSQLPTGVRVLGNLPRDALYARYCRASALVFPSLCDGFGMVVSEALAHGLPVITTQAVGAADLIEEGRNGWVLQSGDVDALAERMQWCLDHPRDVYAMREAAEAAAQRRPWSHYRAELVATICPHVEGG